ncbi:maltose alpha-D-glucosyltransferase [Granulicella mallensis]|uniref:Maltokinase n=1 Tax=Granulicella mallensis (strain ATCC BAA-1857 / DSM 23137 / MP5ACTX8) TaxID=682795 RepID=G8NWY5_GRAMM|nr:maltose alpha-D-glucosyltransferase [Granulicella mallensis]AEU35513.1 trehalose synthase [Granulicella mallensis MP5ACTX8]
MKKSCSATDPLWYKDAIIYELHVRAFADSNDDGIGDFQGLISKLDYLQDLGVTCLWILPFFPSPLRDDGYDIADYTSVNPSYGTIADFQQFLDAAHARNMQVMIELVINHTSDQHPWFQRARHAPKGSPERDYYVWSDSDQIYKDARIIFTDTEKSNWTWDEEAQQYYWHRFFSHQPDLNFDNPAVMEEVLKAMRFWLDMGVDAMRMDAIPYLVERDGTNCENLPETHAAIKAIRAAIDEGYENRLVLAEANQWPADVRPYFGDGDECHMAFHFPLMPRMYMALRQEDRLPITDIMAQTPDIPANCQWGLFLRNHDELTLEMVTDDERDYMYMAYSADPRMRVNVGIRRRLAPLLDNNRRRIELMNSLLLSFPGTPIMYYGDELGMGDNIYLGDRNGVRTPMQWNSDRNAGFSKAVPARLYFPVIMDPIWGYQAINVEAQLSDPSSLLHWTRNMIALRKLFQVFGRGSLEFLHPSNRKVLAYIRDHKYEDGASETVLCVANLSRFAQPVALDLAQFAGRQPMEMLGYVAFPEITDQPYTLTLAPYSFFWLELQPAPPKPEAPTIESPAEHEALAGIVPNKTQASPTLSIGILLQGGGHELLQQLLPNYLEQQRWFGSKSRKIRSATVGSSLALANSEYAVTLIDVTYDNGSTERYQLPLAIAAGDAAETLRKNSPKAILATLGDASSGSVLYDATASEGFRQALLEMFITSPKADATLVASHSPAFDPASLSQTESRVGSAEQSNTSLLFGQTAILKLFRRLQPGENPDVEISRFLTDVAHFDRIPAYLGELHHEADGTTLAFLQAFAANEGDGWSWFSEELIRFYESVANSPQPASYGKPASFLVEAEIPLDAQEHAGFSLEAAALIGTRTAQMHLALATPTDDAAFTAEITAAKDLALDSARIREQVEHTLGALKRNLAAIPDDLVDGAALLLSHRSELLKRTQSLAAAAPEAFGQRIRSHGDYHLGQLLHVKSDFLIVDFEGEPARPLEERRLKQSPLKDVAGMLRSFSYASRSTLDRYTQRRPEHSVTLAGWASLWENAVSTKFLQAYRDAIHAAGTQGESLLPKSSQADTMLRALLLEKSLYELLYELNNRPDWLHIPLSGLLALARDTA